MLFTSHVSRSTLIKRLGETPLNKYEHKQIEKKWQDIWDAKECFVAPQDFTKPKFYALVEFPYPSGQGLHVGHPRSLYCARYCCAQEAHAGL